MASLEGLGFDVDNIGNVRKLIGSGEHDPCSYKEFPLIASLSATRWKESDMVPTRKPYDR